MYYNTQNIVYKSLNNDTGAYLKKVTDESEASPLPKCLGNQTIKLFLLSLNLFLEYPSSFKYCNCKI